MTNVNVVQLPLSDDIYYRICEFEEKSYKRLGCQKYLSRV